MKTRYSQLTVYPSDYLNGGDELLLKTWQVSYYFFDDDHPKGKQIRIKGMNKFDNLADRRYYTAGVIAHEIRLLESGYNPITKVKTEYACDNITSNTPFLDALKMACSAIVVEHHTRQDINSAITKITPKATEIGLHTYRIKDVRKRDIVSILDAMYRNGEISANRYNKIKSYLSILYRYMSRHEIVDYNFIKDIENMRDIKKQRIVVTESDRAKLQTLKKTQYNFFRFITVFFYSGARISELLKVKVKDVDLSKMEFKVTIKKGAYSKEETKAIMLPAVPYWTELLTDAEPEHYVFSERLKPGANSIRRDQITRRWNHHCKDGRRAKDGRYIIVGIGIKADLYTLKHAALDDMARVLGMKYASDMASHTTNITEVYTTQEKQRRIDEMKLLDFKF